MKKILLSAISVIVAGAFVSCNQNNDITPFDGRKDVRFSSNILKVTPPVKTRAANDEWHKNDSIGIFMFESEATNVVEDMSNIKYTTENDGKKATFSADDVVIFFPDNGDEVRFMSYYPYTASIVNNVYKIDVADQTTQAAIDLLYSFDESAKYDKATEDKKVPLVFDHMLTKIKINVKAGEGLENDDLEDIIVTLEGFNTKADFNLISGVTNNLLGVSTITPVKVTTIDNYKYSFESIIIPTTDAGEAKIKFDFNNGNAGQNISSDVFTWSFKNAALNESTEYTYNVTINRSGIVVEAEINNWTSSEENNIDAE